MLFKNKKFNDHMWFPWSKHTQQAFLYYEMKVKNSSRKNLRKISIKPLFAFLLVGKLGVLERLKKLSWEKHDSRLPKWLVFSLTSSIRAQTFSASCVRSCVGALDGWKTNPSSNKGLPSTLLNGLIINDFSY